jgi:hypothetical protein
LVDEVRLSRRNGTLTLENNAVIGTRVIGKVARYDIGDIAIDTLFVGVILPGACFPAAVIINVVFPRRVPEA